MEREDNILTNKKISAENIEWGEYGERVDNDYYKSLQKDLTILNIAFGMSLLTLFVMGILIVTVLI